MTKLSYNKPKAAEGPGGRSMPVPGKQAEASCGGKGTPAQPKQHTAPPKAPEGKQLQS
jgi:hypothetical protein